MSNTALKLALASIKKEKKNYLVIFLIMLLSFTAIITVYNVSYNESIKIKNEKERKYGKWDIVYEDLNKKDISIIKNLKDYDQLINVECTGILKYNQKIMNYNKDFFNMAAIELTGDIPQNSDEIIVKKSIGNIGDYIDLNIEQTVKRFKIVGVVNDYDKNWCIYAFDYFTYHLPSVHHYTFIKGNIATYEAPEDKYIFNLFLNDDLIQIKKGYYKESYETQYVGYIPVRSNFSDESILNIIMAFAVAGIAVAVGYTMIHKQERLLLLKGLGMDENQIRRYLFYETVCLVIISLICSIVLGLVLTFFISYAIYLLTEQYYFHFTLMPLCSYLGILVLLTLVIVYFTYFVLFFRSLDSLIFRKQRTKKNKYHKAAKMHIFNIARREIRHHWSVLVSVNMIALYLLYILNSIISSGFNIQFHDVYKISDLSQPGYQYYYRSEDKMNFDHQIVGDDISEQVYSKYYDISDNIEEGYPYLIATYEQNDTDQYVLFDGQLPVTYHQCLYRTWGSSEYFSMADSRYQIGDLVTLKNDESILEYEITGIILNEYEDDEFYQLNDSFIVFENTIPDDKKQYFYSFSNHRDLTEYFNQNYTDYHLVKEYNNAASTESMAKLFVYDLICVLIGITILVLVLNIFIEKSIQDLRLYRCLGMTYIQMFWLNIFMFLLMIIPLTGIYLACIQNMIQMILCVVFVLLIGLFLVGKIMMKMKKQFEFLPSEVKRYY